MLQEIFSRIFRLKTVMVEPPVFLNSATLSMERSHSWHLWMREPEVWTLAAPQQLWADQILKNYPLQFTYSLWFTMTVKSIKFNFISIPDKPVSWRQSFRDPRSRLLTELRNKLQEPIPDYDFEYNGVPKWCPENQVQLMPNQQVKSGFSWIKIEFVYHLNPQAVIQLIRFKRWICDINYAPYN